MESRDEGGVQADAESSTTRVEGSPGSGRNGVDDDSDARVRQLELELESLQLREQRLSFAEVC